MPEIHIPIVHGQTEGIDPKMLPQGLFTSMRNVRCRKDGRWGSRYGFTSISGAPVNVVASAAYRRDHAIAIASRQAAAAPAQAYARLPSGSYTAAIGSASDIGGVRRIKVAANLVYSEVSSCDVAYASAPNALVYAYVDEYSTTNSYNLTLLVMDAATHKLLGTTTVTANRPYNVKLVVVGQYVFAVWAELTTDAVKSYRWDSQGGGYVFTSTSTLDTAAANRSKYFDIAPLDSTHFLATIQTSGVALKWYSVDITGAATAKATQVIAADVAPTICKDYASTNVYVAWSEGNVLNYGAWDSTGAVVTAKTAIGANEMLASSNVIPAIAPHPTSHAVVVWTYTDGLGIYKIGGSVVHEGSGIEPRSKAFTVGNATYIWAAQASLLNQPAGEYVLLSVDSAAEPDCDAVACYLAAPKVLTRDPRRNAVVLAAASATDPGYVYCPLPVLLTNGIGMDSIRFEYGAYIDRLLPASIGGRVLLSGARVYEYDGNSITPAGLAEGPGNITGVPQGGATGSLSAGTYQYVCVWQWFDSQGNRHLSPPSQAVSETTVATDSVALTIYQPALTSKAITLLIYRTLVGGTIFYLVHSTQIIGTTSGSTTPITYTDKAADATIAVNEVLYTQGDRGAISGTLPHDEPPPCKYIWSGSSRIIMGGLEDASGYQFSKLLFPGEPLTFSAEDFYKGRIPGEVTGVASLDGLWFAGNRDEIYVISGDGPADNGQGGAFADPVKLPSEVGFWSHRSIVEVPKGLLFQGRPDRIYLLARGGNAPVWVGQAVRDTLALYPVIVAAISCPDDNTVRFSCINTAATAGVTIVYDTRIEEWTVDDQPDPVLTATAPHTAHTYNGKIVLDGEANESSAYADGSSVIVSTYTMGDFRPFGPMGYGRNRTINLLGEFRSDCQVSIAMSYDSGQSFPHNDSWIFGSGGQAQTAGDDIQVRWLIPTVRGTQWRPNIVVTPSSVGEGFVMNDISFEVFPEKGTPRLPAAYQR